MAGGAEKTGNAQTKQGSSRSLLASLVYITAYFGHARSAEALSAGLPVEKGGMTPRLFCQAAERAGFRARVVKRAASAIPAEVMPAIVMLKSRGAAVVLQAGKGAVKLLDPESREERDLSIKDFSKEYAGYAIFIRPDYEDDDAAGEPLSRHWLWSTVMESKGAYAQVLLASVLINFFALTSPLFIMTFYNRVLPNDARETGWVLAIGAAVVFCFDFIIRSLRGYFIDVAGRRADVIVGQRLYNQVLDMKLGHRTDSAGAFASIMREFDSLREFLNSATMTGLVDFPFSLLFLAAIWIVGGPQVALVLVGLYVFVAFAAWLSQLPVRRKVHQAMKTAEQRHGLLVETIGSIETIRGVGGEGALRAAHSHYTARAAEAGQASRFFSGLSVNFSILVQQLSVVIIVMIGMYLVASKDMSVGALIACVLLSSRALAPIGQVAGLVNRWHHARSAYRSLDSVMRIPVERPRGQKFLHRPALAGNFRFNGVSFAYPRTHAAVLQNVSLNIAACEKVAIVGRIGSGKSTLVKLLVNFFEPVEGAVLADGTDLRQIDPADLRRSIAYMGQDTSLLSGTVRENIVMGRPDADDAAVLRAAELSGVHDFLRRHPHGYDALVGERGEGLSGGQRQAVALARTLLMDAPVLVMDEPTNAMDTATEELVLRNLEAACKDKTLVIVTHKPALLRLVTRLVVMDGGRIVADGPRDEVLAALQGGQVKVKQG